MYHIISLTGAIVWLMSCRWNQSMVWYKLIKCIHFQWSLSKTLHNWYFRHFSDSQCPHLSQQKTKILNLGSGDPAADITVDDYDNNYYMNYDYYDYNHYDYNYDWYYYKWITQTCSSDWLVMAGTPHSRIILKLVNCLTASAKLSASVSWRPHTDKCFTVVGSLFSASQSVSWVQNDRSTSRSIGHLSNTWMT